MWFEDRGLASVTEDAESPNDFLQLHSKLLQLTLGQGEKSGLQRGINLNLFIVGHKLTFNS
jgi:hypothetical protein